MLQYEYGVAEYEDTQVWQGPVCHKDGIRSYGSMEGGVVFVGISPARDETTRTQRPLTGPSGEMLNSCLQAVGLDRKDFYCTNLVCSWMDEPDVQSIVACQSRLLEELHTLKPRLIVWLGTLVTEFMTGRSFKKVRGAVQWDTRFNCYVMGTYHPSAIYRSMGDYGSSKDDRASLMIYDFVRDLFKIQEVVSWEPGAPESKVQYRVVTTVDDAQNILDNLPRDKNFPITLDVETTYGKDDEEVEVFKDEVLCVGVGSDNFAWIFTPSALYMDGLPALNWPPLHWTMHNSIFDSQVVRRKLGAWLTIKEDTMLQSYSLDERAGVHRLKTLAREYLAAGFYEDDRYYGKLKLEEIPTAMLYEYNAKDVVYTTRLCHKFRAKQIDDNVRGFYEKILIPAVNMYKECQYHGVNIDMKMHMKLTWEWGLQINKLDDQIQEIVQDNGWPDYFNISSSDQVGTFLYKILGMPVVKYTKGGKPSVDSDVIERLREQHEFVPLLERLRRYYKMWGLYIVGLPTTLKVDGRAHPIVKLHGQVNGRPSYSELPVQTFVAPSARHEFNQMRRLIVPPSDEYVIVEVDYGKAELWNAFSYSGDRQMLSDLLSGDYHTAVACDIYHKSREEVTGDDRTWAKRTSFGILYDIEANTLAKLTRSDPITSQDRINRWFKRNSIYKEWFDETQERILREGELVTKTGRKRRIIVLGNAHRAVKQAVNAPIQATSSDTVLVSAVQMHPLLKEIGSHILFTVHDSIVTLARKDSLQEHCKIMHDVMIKQHFDGVVPVPVEIKVGDSWGNTKGIHDCSEEATHRINVGSELGGHCLWPYYTDVLGWKSA